MVFLKFGLVLLAVLLACGANPSSRVDSHNMNVCVDYTDCHVELYQEYVDVKGKLLQYVEHNVVYPNSLTAPNSNAPIICIQIEDLDNNGKGGYYTFIGGGLGQRHATINLKSQRSQGLRFNVRLFRNIYPGEIVPC